jgi:hypothetical protein
MNGSAFHMNRMIFLVPGALVGAFLLAACGPSATPLSGSATGAGSGSSSSEIYSYSTALTDKAATGNSLDASTAAYANAHYGTHYAAADMQCTPTYDETALEEPLMLWSCNYLGNEGTTTAMVKITGAHSWEMAPSSAG